jgi:hypothetical protein
MPARLRLEGVEDFRRELLDLPDHLAVEARQIVHETAENAHREIKEQYTSDELKSHMKVTHKDEGPLHARSVVENTSHLSNWFENGTEERHTKLGHRRGRMPPAHIFVPIVMRARRRMEGVLRELVVRSGLLVR